MRLSARAAIGLFVLAASVPAFAQDWGEYLAPEDFFSVNFPGDPAIRTTTYETEGGLNLPARVYTVDAGAGKYSITAVDWRGAAKMHEARAAACNAAAGTDLRGGENPNQCGGANSGRNEIRGAAVNAAARLIQRGGELALLAFYSAEQVEGLQVQLFNKDNTRTSAVIHWHEYRLYIVEGTAPKNMPEAELFQSSFGFIDEDGKRIQYRAPYSPLAPTPQRSR